MVAAVPHPEMCAKQAVSGDHFNNVWSDQARDGTIVPILGWSLNGVIGLSLSTAVGGDRRVTRDETEGQKNHSSSPVEHLKSLGSCPVCEQMKMRACLV